MNANKEKNQIEKPFRLKAYSFQTNIKRKFSTEAEARHFAALMMHKFPKLLFEIQGEKRIGLERRIGERRNGRDRRRSFKRRNVDLRRDEVQTSIEVELGIQY